MRILRLTGAVEKRLLAARERQDVQTEKVAAKIIADVRRRGDTALCSWTKKLDGINFSRSGMWVSPREIEEAQKSVSADFLRAVKHAIANVRKVAEKQLPRSWSMEVETGVSVGQMVRPIETIGCYIPGGKSTLLSTLIMTAVPAQVAGAKRIVVVCSRPNHELLAAAGILGLSEVARIGGAQAVAALAYGTKAIPRVDKLFGPGNRFVTAAKQLVTRDCAIEHAPDAASILVTTSARLARAVQHEVAAQLEKLPHTNPANVSLKTAGVILLAASGDAAFNFVNRFAPEHLSLPQSNAAALRRISAAGTVFVGPWAAQALGDYTSGSNHVLPTGGWARRRGGLSAADFVKCISVQTIGRNGFKRLAGDVRVLARAENLPAHENAVAVRE